MAGASIAVRIEGQDAIEQRLARLAAKFGDLTPLMDIIGMTLEVDARDNFLGEHSPAGVPWPPSMRVLRTAVGKAGPLPGVTGKTLQDSRRLFESLTHRATATSAEVGTNVVYAARHNSGFSGIEQVRSHTRVMTQIFGVKLKEPRDVTVGAFQRQGNTPKREFLGISAGAREDIEGAVADYAEMEP